MLRRMSRAPPSWSSRCSRIAPQQPASSADQRLDAGRIEHARRRGVDVGHHRRLHAARQQQHLARVRARRPATRARRRGRGTLARSAAGSSGRTAWPSFSAGANSGDGQALASAAQRSDALAGRARAPAHRRRARPMSTRWPYCTPRRAGGFAVAAGQAAVQVQLRAARGACAFEHLLDQVDAAARTVELVAEQLIGRAGRGAEAAVHALAQDRVGLAAVAACLRMQAASRFACGVHRSGIEPAGIEDAVRIEGALQPRDGCAAAAAPAA